MFRLAVFTPPPALDAASELRRPRRRGGIAAEPRFARLRKHFQDKNALRPPSARFPRCLAAAVHSAPRRVTLLPSLDRPCRYPFARVPCAENAALAFRASSMRTSRSRGPSSPLSMPVSLALSGKGHDPCRARMASRPATDGSPTPASPADKDIFSTIPQQSAVQLKTPALKIFSTKNISFLLTKKSHGGKLVTQNVDIRF